MGPSEPRDALHNSHYSGLLGREGKVCLNLPTAVSSLSLVILGRGHVWLFSGVTPGRLQEPHGVSSLTAPRLTARKASTLSTSLHFGGCKHSWEQDPSRAQLRPESLRGG